MKNLFTRTAVICLVFVLLASITTMNLNPVTANAEGFKIGIVDVVAAAVEIGRAHV